ncbi:hypothetical protein [Paraliomyxa miuraensis]|uniref:hypothetical protein n=1 Tax=Paraliomyxa miuraensis TaxID=376150 RepID=UPI0022595396|nr:hypothetical protein [Paraliomyxa miuraensis]MCX4244536.1 hypothetical protein [Paraliomyxa miuraensis]
MQSLLLSDLRLALPDLLDAKAAKLDTLHAGRLYAPRLAAQRTAIEALPAPTAEARPLVEELAQTDAEHDAFATAIWHYTEAVRMCPGLADDVRAAARRIREAFIPKLSVIHRSYATEAAHALGKRDQLPEHAAAFALLPTPSGETLHAWVERFVTRGESIETLLRERANQTAATVTEATRREAAKLRAETIALLGRLRTALADELAATPELLAKTDAELFGYLDQLTQARDEANRRKPSNGEQPPPDAASDGEAVAPAAEE